MPTRDEEVRAAALRWLAVRLDRRLGLPESAVEYENGTEWNEGLATYVEWRLFQVLEGREANPALYWSQGFQGFADLAPQREDLRKRMQSHLCGEINVNNEPYGTAPLRMRLYYSGMAIGALLDRLGADWKEAIFQPGTTLTGLAQEALQATPEELAAALAEARADPERVDLVATKTRLAEDGAADLERMLEDILHGPATTLLVDYSGLNVNALAMSFTPFGLRVVDEQRTIYTMLPFLVRFLPGYQLQQSRPMPLLQDKAQRQVAFQLAEELELDDLLDALDVPELDAEPFEDLHLELPGVTLDCQRARVQWEDGRITLFLER